MLSCKIIFEIKYTEVVYRHIMFFNPPLWHHINAVSRSIYKTRSINKVPIYKVYSLKDYIQDWPKKIAPLDKVL